MTTVRNKDGIEFDIDAIATDINGKVDKDLTNCTRPYIVETYVSGTSWYRIWSDKWCEQGGHTYVNMGGNITDVEFLKPFTSTNYTLTYSVYTANGYGSGEANFRCIELSSNTSCRFYNNSGTVATYKWYACGYIN